MDDTTLYWAFFGPVIAFAIYGAGVIISVTIFIVKMREERNGT